MNKRPLILLIALCTSLAASADDQLLVASHDIDHPTIFQPDFANQAQWLARAEELRKQVLVAEGLWPMPPRTPLNAVIHDEIDRDTYIIKKVFFASYPGHYVSGNLYLPKGRSGKLPAVLSPHGHWTNGRLYEAPPNIVQQQLAEGGEMAEAGARYPLQARCAMLARMGCVVFQYDMVGYADSKPIEHRIGFTDAEAILRLQSFMGLQTWNSLRALDFLTSLPQVDSQRIAVTGASGGGTQTFILGVIDDRPAAEFPAVMVGEAMQGGCICENAPLLRINTNNVEFAATFAPKPLGMSAANDWTRDMETDALPKIRTIYSLFGVPQNVIGKHFNFEHNYNQISREMMYTFLNEHFHLGWPSPVKEVPFNPVPLSELSVYDHEHPRPADASDSKALRQYMTRTSDEQIAAIRRDDPKQYQMLLTTALQVMVADHMPKPADIIVDHQTLKRSGAHQPLPFKRLIPKEDHGDVLIWVDPAGRSSLFDRFGHVDADAQRLLDSGFAIICPDLFLTGENRPQGVATTMPSATIYANQNYAGFLYNFNRSIMAERVDDLLTTIAFAQSDQHTKRIHLLATGDFAPATVLAKALAGATIDRTAVDLNGFDRRRIMVPTDQQMLPGLLKYGGLGGFAALCDSGRTMLAGFDAGNLGADNQHVTTQKNSMSRRELIEYLLQP
jgi:dienelactone hydrolase